MMTCWYPARSEVDYDEDDGYDDKIVCWLCTLHSFLHAHRLSPVRTYVYQSVWDDYIDMGDEYTLCCFILIEPSEPGAVGV